MMSEASFASLGPTLLARKGGAKPAMRPQLTPLPQDMAGLAALAEEQLEDLGWNDMGTDRDGLDAEAPLLSTKPAVKPASTPLSPAEPGEKTSANDGPKSETGAQVVSLKAHPSRRAAANEDHLDADRGPDADQQQHLKSRVATAAENTALIKTRPAKRTKKGVAQESGPTKGRRAAFTLRLDTDRHLKLRLAATMQGVSAQSLVTQALDTMFDDIEALDTLVERMKRD